MSILEGSDPFSNSLFLIWSTGVIHMETYFQQGLEELVPSIFKPVSLIPISPLFSQALGAAQDFHSSPQNYC